ncbi:hypothetical protein BJ970_002804 [Saccharopolyspora phatthalungensis]|uniref:Uncharacterized protein n=2 Tax=Saccharopolyspora phatthalungensis TaxID=664693 RepID=A0A840Q5W3_9PSEU|nr:hypothetical protein [Saccharopolyspora phatthalungensis]
MAANQLGSPEMLRFASPGWRMHKHCPAWHIHQSYVVVLLRNTETALPQLTSALRELNAAGITSVGNAMVGPNELALLQEAQQRQLATLR